MNSFGFKIKYCKCKEGFVGDPSSFISCKNANECSFNNFGCSHICVGSDSTKFYDFSLFDFRYRASKKIPSLEPTAYVQLDSILIRMGKTVCNLFFHRNNYFLSFIFAYS